MGYAKARQAEKRQEAKLPPQVLHCVNTYLHGFHGCTQNLLHKLCLTICQHDAKSFVFLGQCSSSSGVYSTFQLQDCVDAIVHSEVVCGFCKG